METLTAEPYDLKYCTAFTFGYMHFSTFYLHTYLLTYLGYACVMPRKETHLVAQTSVYQPVHCRYCRQHARCLWS